MTKKHKKVKTSDQKKTASVKADVDCRERNKHVLLVRVASLERGNWPNRWWSKHHRNSFQIDIKRVISNH